MYKILDKVNSNNRIPMHMPGHKRNSNKFPYFKSLTYDIDLTEIDGVDNLQHPEGILNEYMEKAAKLFGSKHCFFLTGGSTIGILSGIRALTKDGDKILMPRNCHRSVYNAVELCRLKPIFTEGVFYDGNALSNAVSAESIENKLKLHSDIKLVFITSPTYEGYISDIAKIKSICDRYSVKLMVDEAHGSHLSLSKYFGKSAIDGGADLVVQSLHKTMTGFTQTALLHVNSDNADLKNLLRNINIFQSSSPSYILLSSICCAIDYFYAYSHEIFSSMSNSLDLFYQKAKSLKHLIVKNEKNKDKTKIIIDCSLCDISGTQLMNLLRSNHNIELEMAYLNFALAMTGPGDTDESLDLLFLALSTIDSNLHYTQRNSLFLSEFDSDFKISINDALSSNFELIDVKESVGRISHEYIWVYPPGVPILIPGQSISDESINFIQTMNTHGSNISSDMANWPFIAVCT